MFSITPHSKDIFHYAAVLEKLLKLFFTMYTDYDFFPPLIFAKFQLPCIPVPASHLDMDLVCRLGAKTKSSWEVHLIQLLQHRNESSRESVPQLFPALPSACLA